MATTTGKVVLVTGSNGGFGRLTVETLAREGHTVFASMRDSQGRNLPAAESLRAWAAEHKLPVFVQDLDVTDDKSVELAITELLETAGHIDVAVNNAGVVQAGVTEAFSLEQARDLFEVNFFGTLRVDKAVLPNMRERGKGLLVHISSGIGRLPMAFMGIYSASKFAVEALAESLRYELVPLGVDSVIVEPGAFPTGILDKTWFPHDEQILEAYGELSQAPQKLFQGMETLFQSKRAPNPQDVADAIRTLVDTPFGSRPTRTVVDDYSGKYVEALNACADESLRGMLKAFGN
jgi:NAD(P)-dependent dehydrogenase (short-subunit alcohol dehydrogenase family)